MKKIASGEFDIEQVTDFGEGIPEWTPDDRNIIE